MIINGRAIAADIRENVALALLQLPHKPALAIIIVGENPVIENFVGIKRRVGESLGVTIREHRFPQEISGEELEKRVRAIAANEGVSGVIIQLPLPACAKSDACPRSFGRRAAGRPAAIPLQAILDAVPTTKDIDMLSRESVAAFRRGESNILPPVAGAIQEILERAKVSVAGKEALVLGHGRLVGIPAALLLRHNGAHVTVIDQEIANLGEHTKESDIIVCGVGKPGLLKPEMLKKGAVLIDAGTSEAGGKLMGDADPNCAEVASVFTPVPGGVGPITVAMIFKNLCVLARR